MSAWASALLALAACSDDSVVQTTSDADAGGGTVSVSFLSPSAGEVFETTTDTVDIVAELQVLGLELADGGPLLSLSLDGVEVATLATGHTYTFAAVPLGSHTLGVQALRSEGVPFDGADYVDEVTVVVKKKADAPECTTDADCASKASGPCQTASCDKDEGTCRVVNEPTTTVCDDGDACTEDDHCDAGACVAGKPKACNDDNGCTDDACNPDLGCVYTNNVAACDDGDACTGPDQCQGGACKAGPDICGECNTTADCASKEDGNLCNGTLKCQDGSCVLDTATIVDCAAPPACKTVACNPSSGQCVLSDAAAGLACDDGDGCTVGDACQAGVCTAGPEKDCDDGSLCTTDSCNPATGNCSNTPITLNCDDGNLCTTDACDPATGACAHLAAVLCDDGDACTDEACDPATGACFGVPLVVCDDDDPCTDDSCDPATGGCTTAPNTAPCDDHDPCTTDDVCSAGECTPGTSTACDDGNPCTNDACNPTNGACIYTPNTAPCNDGNACTSQDTCKDGACGGVAKVCNDGDPCTDDACDAVTGACTTAFNTAPCDDKDPCTQGDVCAAGACTPGALLPSCALDAAALCAVAGPTGTSITCPIKHARFDDGTPLPGTLHFVLQFESASLKMQGMTDTVCFGASCVAAAVPPNKLSPSGHTASLTPASPANWLGNVDVHLANVSDPASPLTEAWLAGGAVQGDPEILTLHMSTKIDIPVEAPVFVYLHNVTSWSTAGAELHTWVQDGLIVSAPTDRCIPAAAALCDDGDPCNGAETCDAGSLYCQAGDAPYCGDGTEDLACGEVCDDGNNDSGDGCNASCTSNEECGNGFVDPGEACDDGNELSDDGCNASCTSNEECGNGFTDPGEDCDDGNELPNDGCSPECLVESLDCTTDADCDDGSVCTGIEKCVAGGCKPGTSLNCADGVACTLNTCDPVLGCVFVPDDLACSDGNSCTDDICDLVAGCQQYVKAPGAACDDGNPCTTNDTCAGVKCTAGPLVNCDDGIACTVDSCTAQGTCVNLAENQLCDDGNACTADACDALDGCYHIPLSALPCSDGNPCTQDDQCQDGVCVAGGPHPGCGAPPGFVCDLSGSTGEIVTCSVRVARETEADPPATGIEFAVDYDETVLQLDNFYDELCFPGFGCFETPVTGPGSTPLSTGHSVSIAPTKVADWKGSGAVVIVNTSDPTVPLSNAYIEAGAIEGEPEMVRVKFKLLSDVAAGNPAQVELTNLVSADGQAATLVSEIINAIIVTWAQ
ncbi:MAG: hypothetical protein AMXMBFR64_00700 [Myxococcales bacterium]